MSLEIVKDIRPESEVAPSPRLSSQLASVLRMAWVGYVVRGIFTFMFWSSGLAKLLDVDAGLAEMRHFGLEPAVLFYAATVAILLGGSFLVILDRWTWLGAGILAVFTVLTIPIAHGFWAMEEPLRTLEFHVVMEHITVVGGLLVVIYASATRKAAAS
ncbi:hypothetical protein K32_15980 [Kaistia sp. 32K]|uniref:DoxX family protein n=1 Tax=Kaistia sp. 32K TaxID=2795690 RepID=UPI0019364F7F|nr:DoxX family protein [Kaistia sp. 32K]BCP52981.1 hypothetical protein K32_15980 [Kaistia sp. 32K]